jgi:tetratricopeptide (TPR) repeat protein
MKKCAEMFGVFSMSLLVGCSAAMDPYTRNPQKKLNSAKDLFEYQDQPLPAERLIREAIESFKKTNDDIGLADAYRLYGFFFQSEAVDRRDSQYRKHGFLDKSATFEGRKNKALEYFEEARALYSNHNAYDRLMNVDLNAGFLYERMSQLPAACRAYDRALEDYKNNMKTNPGEIQTVPDGFSSLTDFFIAQKRRVKCPL